MTHDIPRDLVTDWLTSGDAMPSLGWFVLVGFAAAIIIFVGAGIVFDFLDKPEKHEAKNTAAVIGAGLVGVLLGILGWCVASIDWETDEDGQIAYEVQKNLSLGGYAIDMQSDSLAYDFAELRRDGKPFSIPALDGDRSPQTVFVELEGKNKILTVRVLPAEMTGEDGN
ncbi:hypothetical protein [Aeromicrobium sp. 179-A 4D2 NHS]|uniref:hypothetical protein n=1 Tax=Aeromicrobium sp. 179-A 4D2 NHS TaxID=3142375 RepID=UPI0039A0215D